MKENEIEKMLSYLRREKKKFIIVLKGIFKEQNISKDNKIKLDNRILKELFLKKANGYYSFDYDTSLDELYERILFDDFIYDKLYISQKTLDLMAKYNIKFYTDKIFNKDISNLKLKGVYVEGNFDDFNINGSDFTGVKGKAIINPQKVKNKSLYDVILSDAYIDGSFEDCYILGANFKNAKGEIRINPQVIGDKNLLRAVLDGVYIDGSFDDCMINQTNFTNHKGKVTINPQKICKKSFSGTVFSGVNFIGSFNGCKLYKVDFTNSIGANINLNEIVGDKYWGINSNFKDAKLYGFEGPTLHNYIETEFKSEMELSRFRGATLVYQLETKHLINEYEKNPNLKDAIFVYEDEQLESDIKNVFEEEIKLQKVKKESK